MLLHAASAVLFLLASASDASIYPLNASALEHGAFYMSEGPMYGGEGAEVRSHLEIANGGNGAATLWLGLGCCAGGLLAGMALLMVEQHAEEFSARTAVDPGASTHPCWVTRR